jgi:hypothetical protein
VLLLLVVLLLLMMMMLMIIMMTTRRNRRRRRSEGEYDGDGYDVYQCFWTGKLSNVTIHINFVNT